MIKQLLDNESVQRSTGIACQVNQKLATCLLCSGLPFRFLRYHTFVNDLLENRILYFRHCNWADALKKGKIVKGGGRGKDGGEKGKWENKGVIAKVKERRK